MLSVETEVLLPNLRKITFKLNISFDMCNFRLCVMKT